MAKMLLWVLILAFVLPLISTKELCPHELSLKKWSDTSTWPNNKLPALHEDVVIHDNILLDTTPPELRSLKINPGSRLVWSPDGSFLMTVKYIHIHGRMDIGSEDCPYTGTARITLTGKRGEYDIPGFNEKFIGVDKDGTLEIHGQNKLAWTKLSKTLRKLTVGDGIIHGHLESEHKDLKRTYEGIAVYSVDLTSMKTEYDVFYVSGRLAIVDREIEKFKTFLNGITPGNLVFIAAHDKFTRGTADHTELFNAVEELAFGKVTGNSLLRNVGEKDAYVLLTIKGDISSTIENADHAPKPDPFRHAIAEMNLWKYNVRIFAESNIDDKVWKGYVNLFILDIDRAYPVLDVIDDTSTWQTGDKLLITSTDYDWKQTEIGTVVDCQSCTSKQVRIDLITRFTHFGEIYNTVDMRGEVALLSRNIVIEGKVGKECPPENGNCNDYNYDTFGGHIKAVRGFKNMHIEGAELVHLGQQTDLGRYPLHFHMCHDVDTVGGYDNPPYLRNNAIHDTFARCITIHGTHGVTVQDNVCYKFLGHGYFLEDGGEKRTVFDGNLGLGTMKGSLIPTDDSNPSTFWITNPLTYMRNNVGAGGDGLGMWIILVDVPLGPSKNAGFMKPGEAFGTALLEFNNNVFHSNGQTGFFLDRKLLPDGTLDPTTLHYTPRVDPFDYKSAAVEVVLNRLTIYKNTQHAWIRGGWIHVTKSSLSDAATGLTFARGGSKGEQFLTDSVVIGESINIGEPLTFYNRTSKQYRTMSRSHSRDINWPVQGFVVYDGPVYVDNVWFDKFKRTADYEMGAIGFLLNNKFASATVSTITRAMFGFDDGPATGNRVFDGDASMFGFNNLDGDKLATVRDGDGSVTSFPGYQIVKPTDFYTTSECAVRTNWKMAYCPHKYGRIYFRLYSSSDLANAKAVIVRDDIPDSPEFIAGTKMIEVGVILGGTHSYTINFGGKIPRNFMLQGRGIDGGYPVRFGICIPKGATFDLKTYVPVRARELSEWKQVGSIEELDADTVGGSYFHDTDVGMLFLKFLSHKKRLNTTTTDCEWYCPYVQIKIQGGDETQADCRQRAYPKYKRQPLASNYQTPSDVILPATSTTPPSGLGAGSTKPFETRIQVAGGFGQWSEWGKCSSDCGGGIQFRKRACDSPIPANGGADCQGPRMEQQTCNTQNCPIDGGFGPWENWSECRDIVSCKGHQERSRKCDNPSPQFGGDYCSGSVTEVQTCTGC